MPELPEIETVKLQLQKVLVGQKLVKVTINNPKTVQGNLDELKNKSVLGINRLGKVLLIEFGPKLHLGFHFKMTGQLIYESNNPSMSNVQSRIVGGHPSDDFVAKMPNNHTRVFFEFTNGKLFFNDMRKFGWVQINPKFVDALGPEPFEMTTDKFITNIHQVKRPIKIAIMDQALISGVGNIYANDALWEAQINPQTSSHKLHKEQLELLLEKIKFVLAEGIKYGGATAENYVNLHGLGGHYQEHFRTYNKEGEPCLRPACRQAGAVIKKITLGGRGTYFCPACQK